MRSRFRVKISDVKVHLNSFVLIYTAHQMSSVKAKNVVISAQDSDKFVSITLNTSNTSYSIALPTSPPNDNTALFFDGQNYVWKEVAQSIPADQIPQGYESFQVFSSNLLVQSSEIQMAPEGGAKVRMQVNAEGTVFFQRFDENTEEWVGAMLSLDS